MKKLFTLLFLAISFSFFAQKFDPEYVDGQVWVKFRTGTIKGLKLEDPNNIRLDKITLIKNMISKYGITKASKPFYQADDDIKLTHLLQFEFTNHAMVNDFINELIKSDLVEYAEKVMLLQTHVTPNDYTNVIAGNSASVHLQQINAPAAWNIFNGNSNITVAIVDNAIATNHVDLNANIWVNPNEIPNNSIDDDGNGYIDDVNGYDVADWDNDPIPTNSAMNHGTHCSGIAGGRTDNSTGISSIGWNIKVIAVKCAKNTDPTTSVGYGYQGIIYAAKAGARVISCSWGGTGSPSAGAQSVIDYAWNKGCVIFVSAGNDGNSVLHYPAAYNNVFSVAAVDASNIKASFSCYGTWVDIAAPGVNILSTLPGNTYNSFSGTSMACPMVAGLAGLMLSKCPFMTQNDVLNCISTTAANIYSLSGNSSYAPNLLGAGRIDAYAAMNCAAGFLSIPPIANFFTLTKNTCPNTSISFQDSSLYAPTSWTWNFQGGSPATSTSSNPSVSWPAPGVYNVTLTAGNSNGSNVKQKVSYITIAGPMSLPLQEGFQNTQFVPANWSSYNVDNDSVFWKRKIGVGGFVVSGSAACAMFDNYDDDATGTRDEIRTPRYDFSNVANAHLRFDVAYKQYDNSYSDTLVTRLTTDCGTTWSSIYTKGGSTLSSSSGTLQANIFVPTASQWRTDSVTLNSFAAFQPNVMIGFENHGHYGQAMYVDNINIFIPAPNVAVANASNGCTGASYTFTNNTTGAAGYTWTANPAASISAPNGTNTNITFANAGTYSVTLTAINGTVTSSVTKTISISTQPTVALSTSTTNICSGTQVTLTASGASSYSWSTSSTSTSIVVTPTITTTYSVTGTNGVCTDLKTSQVTVTLTPNVSVSNQTICASGTATLNASGASTYSWSTGYIGNPLTVTPSSNTVYTVYGNNGICSDTKTVSVSIGSSITIIPAENTPTICTGGTVALSASGASTYTWMPGNINGSALTVTPSTSTNYTVTGSNNGCNGSSTINVSIVTPPVLNLTPSTSSVCAGSSVNINASGYTTYTWTPGNLNGSSQSLSPGANQVYTVSGTIGNCAGTSTALIDVYTYPSMAVSGNTTICEGYSTTLTASGATTYTWTSGNNTAAATLNPLTTTSYVVTGYNSTCSSTVAVTVSVNPNPTISISTPTNPLCIGNGVNLTGSGATTYTWSTNSTFSQIYITPTVNTTYTLVGAVNGCTSQAVFTQSVIDCSGGSVGLHENQLTFNGLTIYPNPTQQFIYIEYPKTQFSYTIFDNLGRKLISESDIYESKKLDLQNYSKGIYYIEIKSGEAITRKKLILD